MDAIEGVSLVLTSPTVWLAVGVIAIWWTHAFNAWKLQAKDRKAYDWLIMGVCIGFLGSVMDNLYWGLAWTLDFLSWEPYRTSFFNWGALPNIFFRQGTGIAAAHCHIMSYLTHHRPDLIPAYKSCAWLSLLFGIIWVMTMLLR